MHIGFILLFDIVMLQYQREETPDFLMYNQKLILLTFHINCYTGLLKRPISGMNDQYQE